MSFIEKLDYLISQKGTTRNQVFKELKIAKNSYVNWSNRGTLPGGETLIALANYFNVSTDYLLGRDKYSEREIQLTAKVLSEPENRLLSYFGLLDDMEKGEILGELKEKTRGRAETEEEKNGAATA